MATTPRSYKKNGYTYTESAPGSNKFQNFKAAPIPMGERERPTVKRVREESRDKKAAVVQGALPKYRGGPEGDGKVVSSKVSATPTSDYRSPRSRSSATPTSDYRAAPIKKSYPARQGGMDNAVPPSRKKYPNRQGGMDTGNLMKARPSATPISDYRSRPAKKSILGQIIGRVTQPPAPLHPEAKKLLDNARKDMDIVANAFLGGSAGARYKLGKAITDEIKKVKNSLSFWGS